MDEFTFEDVMLSSDRVKLDLSRIEEMLRDAFWCRGITINEISKGIRNSALVVGAYTKNNGQVGFIRVVSDKTRFAYILDVIVDARYRKHGIGQKMVRYALDHCEMRDFYQWVLNTKDAQVLYSKLGFKKHEITEFWMMINVVRREF